MLPLWPVFSNRADFQRRRNSFGSVCVIVGVLLRCLGGGGFVIAVVDTRGTVGGRVVVDSCA